MEIKKEKQLRGGDIIFRNGDQEKLMVLKCYPHHVLFRSLEEPYPLIDITNNELYQMGKYTEKDFVREFTK